MHEGHITMRWLVYAVLLVGPIFAEKERIEDDTFPELANDLLIEIQKRLREYDDTTSDEELGYDACAFQSTNGSIIRTQDSIQRGAEFINSLDVKYIPELDREYCLQSCCETTKCNLAVFKDKGTNHSCYLFDCGTPSVCVFTPHPGFSIHMLPNRQMTNKAQEMRADELQNLGMEKTTTTTTTTVAPTTTTPTTTTTETTTTSTSTTTQAPDMHQPVALFGMCKDHKDCAGSFTECLAGYCLCRDNYHAQDGMCRPKTPASSSDNPPGREGAGPIESTDKWPPSSSKEDKDSESMDVSHKQGSIVPHNDPKTHTSAEGDQNISLPQKSDNQSEESDSQSSESDSHSEESDSQSSEDDNSQSAESDSHSLSDSQSPKSLNADHDSLVVSSPDDADDSKMVEQPAETQHHSKEEIDIDSESTQLVESNDSPSVKKVVDVQVEINEASQDAGRSKTVMLALSNKSAIVALALGLVITAMLLVFVGCRLRNMRKRLRKGRPLNSNEADYLINGMYL